MVGAEHTGATQWDAGHALADYIERTAVGAANCSNDGWRLGATPAGRSGAWGGAGTGKYRTDTSRCECPRDRAGDEGVAALNLNIKGNTRASFWPALRCRTISGRRRRHRRSSRTFSL